MRPLILTILFFIAVISTSKAQQPVVDRFPNVQIYVIDSQSGEEVPATSDAAILFKDALVALVRSTSAAKQAIAAAGAEHISKVMTITQMGQETNVNGYQVMLERPGAQQSENVTIYTFVFHVDTNILDFYDPASQQWIPETIEPTNKYNLRMAVVYARRFNEELANQPVSNQNGQDAIDASVDINQPVDDNVAADTQPPPIPEYEQPECPSDDYLWQPGYWAFSPGRRDYYWVPGAWVAPPTPGVLWTPPYWGYEGSRYVFHIGYWGDHVGFYGGINYGYGYSGRGYYGGEWRRGHFHYNTAVVHVNTRIIHNTYINRTVINTTVINNRYSFNGRGGVAVQPSKEELAATREHHLKPTPEQNVNQLRARNNPNQFTKGNGGAKPVFASPKIAPFHPQNNSGNKGIKPDNGKPGIQGTNPGRPNVQGGNPGRPKVQGTNPDKPKVQTTNPGIQGTNPDKPKVQTTNPGVQGTNPDKPKVQNTNPGVQGTNPDKPKVQNTNPGTQGTNPDKPKVQTTNPGIQGTNPDKPKVQTTNPGVQGTNPDKTKVQTTNPGIQETNPDKPKVQTTSPGIPGTSPEKPKVQQQNTNKPQAQKTPATKPVKPADNKPKSDPPKPKKQQ